MLQNSLAELFATAQQLADAGRGADAIAGYRAWLAVQAEHPLRYAVLFNLGILLDGAGDADAATDAFREAAQRNPSFLPPFISVGLAHERRGEPAPAMEHWSYVARAALATADGITCKVQALKHMSRLLEDNRALAQAEGALRQVVEISPDQADALQRWLSLRQRLCTWPLPVAVGRLSRTDIVKAMAPLSLAAWCDDPLLHLAAGWACSRREAPMPSAAPPAPPTPPAQTRLRVGYLSSDLRDHAIGHLTAGMFRLHDRAAFEVFVYYCGIPQDDATKLRIRADVEHWRDIAAWSDDAAFDLMRQDGIDILVDLNGHTRGSRATLLARQPAPVLVNWLGFPGSMGSAVHHYIIADAAIVPPDHERYYSETVLRLPCYQPNDRDRPGAERIPARAEVGLPEDALVLCSFNGPQKVTRFGFDRWMQILHGVPDAVLWLMQGGDEVQQRMRDRAAAAGIAPERLVFAPPMRNLDHVARYALADLFLDTAPYGAHTTASDALWMGLPVLTTPGRSFASRVCASLVRAAGVPELICATSEDYVRRAIALGRDRSRLAAFRTQLLRDRATSLLFDTPLLVRKLEDLFRRMQHDALAGRTPRPDLANLEIYLDIGAAQDHDAAEVPALADYAEGYEAALARRHAFSPLPPDARLWPPPTPHAMAAE